jgi:hypothetical protein
MKPVRQKQWSIFYEVNGATYGVFTHLGCLHVAKDRVNVFTDRKVLDEYFARAIKIPTATAMSKDYDTYMKPEFRGGRMFIARVASKHYPARLLEAPRFQAKDGWALRVPCVFASNKKA